MSGEPFNAGGSTAGQRPATDGSSIQKGTAGLFQMTRLIGGLDRLVAAILSGGRWLLLPVVALLFLQWPLRDLFRNYSREANDLGQWIFALYVAMAFTAATRAHTHLAADTVARLYSERTRARLARAGALIGLVPWALFVILGGANLVLSSLSVLEKFADTSNPGYFLIKFAVWVLAGLILCQAIIDIAHPRRSA
jgi:TRAP-type mannitol/chloroaromatic compound transport system permease small subunit